LRISPSASPKAWLRLSIKPSDPDQSGSAVVSCGVRRVSLARVLIASLLRTVLSSGAAVVICYAPADGKYIMAAMGPEESCALATEAVERVLGERWRGLDEKLAKFEQKLVKLEATIYRMQDLIERLRHIDESAREPIAKMN
jgi:hypothetical protein